MLTDIQIAQNATCCPLREVAAKLGLAAEDVIPYGRYKAKLSHKLAKAEGKDGKLILVTAISPTPAGEGKTTTSVGLGDALCALGKTHDALPAGAEPWPRVRHQRGCCRRRLRPRLCRWRTSTCTSPGDIHAIGTANNLLAAMIDNSIQQGNPLNIDPRRITWKRCMDMNDRQLRFIVDGLGGKVNGTPREDGFDITVASEIMAIFCLGNRPGRPQRPAVPHCLRLHL